jgi:hypothetical protein
MRFGAPTRAWSWTARPGTRADGRPGPTIFEDYVAAAAKIGITVPSVGRCLRRKCEVVEMPGVLAFGVAR